MVNSFFYDQDDSCITKIGKGRKRKAPVRTEIETGIFSIVIETINHGNENQEINDDNV